MPASEHVAVLVEETMRFLNVRPGGWYIDATLGGGTHTRALLERSAPDGRVLSLDVDVSAINRMRQSSDSWEDRWVGLETNFRHLADAARQIRFFPVQGTLLDLGLSSDELADPKKGLSFLQNGPLDMRLGPQSNEDGLTAAEIINQWPQEEIIRVLQVFGEERFARRIGQAIIHARHTHPIVTTQDLVDIIQSAVPAIYEKRRIHPATRTFQALRLAVNDELESLKQAIGQAASVLAPGGRLAIISFHSLEDRIVKQAFQARDVWLPITKRPVIPGETEQNQNPRSRSAKLRVAEIVCQTPTP